MKITSRLILLLVGSVGIVYILLQLYVSDYYAGVVRSQIKNESELLTSLAINKIYERNTVVQGVVDTAVVGLQMGLVPEKQLYDYIKAIFIQDKKDGGFIYGGTYASASGAKPFAPYVWYEDGKYHQMDLYKAYNYFDKPWFKVPFETKKPVWSKPYFDAGGGDSLMITYSYPVLRGGKVQGVATADVTLDSLQEYLKHISRENEYMFILYNKDGTYISHPETSRLAKSAFEANQGSPELLAALQKMVAGETATEQSMMLDKPVVVNFTTIPELGWSVGIVFDKAKMEKEMYNIAYKNIAIIFVGLLFIMLVIAVVARSITKPLRNLTAYVENVSEGNLTGKVPYVKGKDEIAELAQNFSFMQDELKKYIETEKETAVKTERMEGQIRFAKEIQESFLPEAEKISEEDDRFDIDSFLSTAQGVGGDLYDYFMVDKDNLFIVLGDVADKGVPASLYMAITMAFARVLGRVVSSPAEVVGYINNYLVRYNKNNMFVTMMVVMINLETNQVRLVDAGHGMAYHIHKGKPVRPPMIKNMALGVKADIDFKETSFKLDKKDALFFYTDGMTDAKNAKRESFGEERVVEALKGLKLGETCKENMDKLVKVMQTFIKGARRVDDIAMVLLRMTK